LLEIGTAQQDVSVLAGYLHQSLREGFLGPPLYKPFEHAIPDLGQSELLASANWKSMAR
jgi:hypothetical protein